MAENGVTEICDPDPYIHASGTQREGYGIVATLGEYAAGILPLPLTSPPLVSGAWSPLAPSLKVDFDGRDGLVSSSLSDKAHDPPSASLSLVVPWRSQDPRPFRSRAVRARRTDS